MEQKVCSFTQRNDLFLSDTHPLHLLSDKVKWISAFGRCDSPCIASLSHQKDAYHSQKTKLFVLVHLDHHPEVYHEAKHVSIPIDESQTEDEIVLISSDEFHHHYGISKQINSLVIGPVSAFPLSRILLCARTEETFHWVDGLAFERGLMVTGACHKNLLVRQGDQFLGSPAKIFGDDHTATLQHFQNLITLECYPVKQGYIHAKTEIIITDPNQYPCMNETPQGFTNYDGINFELITQDILRRISLRNGLFDPLNDALCSEELAHELNVMNGDLIKAEISLPTLNEVADDDSGLAFRCDNSGFEEPQATKLYTICHIRVGLPCQEDLFAIDAFTLNKRSLYVSPLLWFNAKSAAKIQTSLQNLTVKVETLNDGQIPYAKEIHLALVLSPRYSPSAQFDKTLMKHLSNVRILKKNDVITIETEGNADFLCECDIRDARCPALHYKVMRFGDADEKSCQTYFKVDLKHTSLYQTGTTNSFIPRLLEISKDDDTPLGLSHYVDEMRNILTPYVSKEMDDSIATILLSGSPGCGKKSVLSSVAKILNLHVLHISCYELMSDSSGATDAKINTAIQRATVYAPCLVVLNGIECIGREPESGQPDHRVCSGLQNAIESLQSDDPILIVAVTSNPEGVVSNIKSLFLYEVDIKSLSEKERQRTIQQLISLTPSGKDINVQWLAKHTMGFNFGELWELLRQATANARDRITKECAVGSRLSWMDEMNICAAGITNQHCDFVRALQQMQSQRADIIGVPKIPDVKWDDIGGLEDVKNVIKDTIQLPLEHPELVAAGLRRSGILLYGPPGTGKTLLAKAVATQCSLSFLSVKGPELINMYVGQSEENVRKVFSRARGAAPCVVFFDELDSLAPNRGRSGDSGGVMDRVVSQLLAELDGLVEADAEKQIFVIGASNRPDLIDPALLRPGRFDKLLYVGINENKADQLKILEAQTRKANLSPEVSLHAVIELCPDNMTGADFYALTTEATMNAIRRRIEFEEGLGDDDSRSKQPLVVEQKDFLKAAKDIVPSVSKRELARFQEISNQLSSR